MLHRLFHDAKGPILETLATFVRSEEPPGSTASSSTKPVGTLATATRAHSVPRQTAG
jgi:hypothetical protein